MLALPLLFPLLLLEAPAAAPDTLQERVRVEYVLVQVRARDKDGRLVTDLGLDDFILTENGEKVRIESLDIIDLREGAEPPEPHPPPSDAAGARRLTRSRVVLALDFQFIGYAAAQETFRELERFLGETVGRDRLELMLYSLEGGRLLDTFTIDPGIARQALADYRLRLRERAEKQGERGPVEGRFGFAADLDALERRLEECPQGSFVQYWNCIQGTLAEFLEVQNDRTDTVLRELEALATELAGGDSVSSVVFASPGFSATPGVAAKQLADSYLHGRIPSSSGRANGNGVTPPDPLEIADPPPKLVSFEPEVARLLEVCARSQVVFHTFDLYHFGLEQLRRVDAAHQDGPSASLPSYRLYVEELESGMWDIAEETGGTFHAGPTLNTLHEVMEGTRFVYVLGYTRPAGREESYRKLRVKCLRKGVTLAHRKGYVG